MVDVLGATLIVAAQRVPIGRCLRRIPQAFSDAKPDQDAWNSVPADTGFSRRIGL